MRSPQGPLLPERAAVAYADATPRRASGQPPLPGGGRLDDGDRRAGLDRLARRIGRRLGDAEQASRQGEQPAWAHRLILNVSRLGLEWFLAASVATSVAR